MRLTTAVHQAMEKLVVLANYDWCCRFGSINMESFKQVSNFLIFLRHCYWLSEVLNILHVPERALAASQQYQETLTTQLLANRLSYGIS